MLDRKNGLEKSVSGKEWAAVHVHEQLVILNQLVILIFYNFVPNKTFLGDDRDPPWMNDIIKSLINPLMPGGNKKVTHT